MELPHPSVDMVRRHQSRLALLKPAARSWIKAQAMIEEKRGKLDVNEITAAVRQRFAGSASPASVEQLTFIILMSIVQDAQNDLQQQMAEMQAETKAKAALRGMLQKMDQELAVETAASANRAELVAPCQTAFCRALPARLADINAEVQKVNPRGFKSKFQPHLNYSGVVEQQGRVNLDSDVITYQQLRSLKSAVSLLENELISDTETNATLQSQVQLSQQAYAQASQLISNIEKADENATAAELANLK